MAFIEKLILKQPLKHSCSGTIEEFEKTGLELKAVANCGLFEQNLKKSIKIY